ncbi:MAG: pseudouridine-5'-phosphate glycosidase [Rhodospirillales bacterium]|nr:pseudouridine-5'-phosphate glycosidase [Rhodospirillales bacterium]
MEALLDIRPEVAAALAEGRPVVALESTLIAHGLPYPRNLETAKRAAACVRAAGAVPATVGVAGGRLTLGLDGVEIERFARSKTVVKVSRRDLAAVTVAGGDGATTVAATMIAAHLAGIGIVTTGGIGGVHMGGEASLDMSADLAELARTPVAVVCAGAKAILDLPRTLEVLETQGVPVVGYATSELPAFYCRSSGLPLEARVDTPEAAARLLRAHRTLAPGCGLLIVNPPSEEMALASEEMEAWIAQSIAAAEAAGIGGKRLTPFLLERIAELSGGRSLEANLTLIEANAELAGRIAAAEADLDKQA